MLSELVKAHLATVSLWIVNVMYCLGLVPQIITNYRLKEARGMSKWMLYGYSSGYIAYLYYVFCLDLPLAYKVWVPLSFVAVTTLVGQRFYYHSLVSSRLFATLYVCSLLLAWWVFPWAREDRFLVGGFGGWMAMVIWSMYQIPQVMKIYRRKSVDGFSFSFITTMAVAVGIEFCAGLALSLPWQSVVSNARAMLVYGIFCVQFFLYARR